MFGLSKENKGIISATNSKLPGVPVLEVDLDKEITIHTMPVKFRAAKTGGNTKATGIVILAVGALFLIAGSAGMYYFLFLNVPTSQPVATTTAEVGQEIKKDEPKIAKEAEAVSSSSLVSLVATSTVATTTDPEMPIIVATSTETNSTPLAPSTDSDRDGLTDAEETVLGINAFSADSDGDGYTDLAELSTFYDPAGTGKLEANLKIKKYSNNTYNYNLLYPGDWLAKSQGGDFLMRFTGPNEQFFQIEVQPNTSRLSIIDWYRQEFGESAPANRLIEQKGKAGKPAWFGVKSEDGMTVYLTDNKSSNIFTMSYNAGLSRVVDYPNLFTVFFNSLEFAE